MRQFNESATSRRLFLQFLAASPLIGSAVHEALAVDAAQVPPRLPDPISWGPLNVDGLIKSPQEALSVFDFELVARQKVPPAHFGKVATGSDDEFTMRANRADFAKVRLLPRRLRDVSKPDSSITLFGVQWDSPVFICPAGASRAMHPDGDVGVSKAAEAGKHLQILAASVSTSIEDCMAARGGTPIWFQLYPQYGFEITKDIIARAERRGAPVLVLTIDMPVSPNFETLERLTRLDHQTCTNCHQTPAGGPTAAEMLSRPHYASIPPERYKTISSSPVKLDWDFVRRLRDATKMKVVLKGIIAPEDAALCVKYGFDGMIVSNHGGRAGDFGTSSISVLPEIVAVVKGKIPILVDSGFRRGMDVIKALAMGATAVGICRPYLWGLGAFGQAGVERVLEILRTETRVAMAQAGAPSLKDLVPAMIHVDQV
ncbi:MAG: alpha-hydroxy-acid oxidizing protein [Acidobacteria bacterium]|nr:alpha-hydroxy-acid oxidizing protein [Acidobacteriota bacterium]